MNSGARGGKSSEQIVGGFMSDFRASSDSSGVCLRLYGFLCAPPVLYGDCLHLHACDPNLCAVSPALVCPACLLCADIWCRGRLSAL